MESKNKYSGDAIMANCLIIAGPPNSGKTTSCKTLTNYYRSLGFRVANILFDKGSNDSYEYQYFGYHRFSVPLEVVKGKTTLEKWLPTGYDLYIIEMTLFLYSRPTNPISLARQNIFDPTEINEVIPYPYIEKAKNTLYTHIVSKAPLPQKGHTTITMDKQLHSPELLSWAAISPQLDLPNSEKQVIGYGFFPGEIFNIFSHNFSWHPFNIRQFVLDVNKNDPDIIILGSCDKSLHPTLKKVIKYLKGDVISYCPPLHYDVKNYPLVATGQNPKPRTSEILNILLSSPPGTPFPSDSTSPPDSKNYYLRFNNSLWVRTEFDDLAPVTQQNNTIICNGWVSPVTLIREGLLCV